MQCNFLKIVGGFQHSSRKFVTPTPVFLLVFLHYHKSQKRETSLDFSAFRLQKRKKKSRKLH